MRPARRRAFVVSPRIAFPALLVIVILMFFVFASLDSGDVSTARVVATVIVSAAILILFGMLAVASRVGRRESSEDQGTSTPALSEP